MRLVLVKNRFINVADYDGAQQSGGKYGGRYLQFFRLAAKFSRKRSIHANHNVMFLTASYFDFVVTTNNPDTRWRRAYRLRDFSC